MKTICIGLLVLASLVTFCFADDYVKGYFRSDGTYVSPYYRSDRNSTVIDNYSFKNNYNPYTGSRGSNYYRNNFSNPYYGTQGKSNKGAIWN